MVMTSSELNELNRKLPELKKPELNCALRNVIASHLEVLAILDGHEEAEKNMTRDYQTMKELSETLKRENERLSGLLQKCTEQLQMRNNDLFGRGTEKLSEIAQEEEIAEDPLAEEAEESPKAPVITSRSAFSDHKGHGIRKKGQREKDLSGLPVRNIYQINPDQLNEQYGTSWYIFSWKKYRTVECVPSRHYVQCVYVPVISHGTCCREIEYTPYEGKPLPGSIVSSSLLADILYYRFCLYVPYYRMEKDMAAEGFRLTRGTMSVWIMTFTDQCFLPVWQYMADLLKQQDHQQADETFGRVINDGRSAGSTSYYWLHTSSEFYTGNKIICFCFELTRSTDHLREFYGDDFKGKITSDAYAAYSLYASERNGSVINTLCWMHCRREFIRAARLLNSSKLREEELETFPEFKAIELIRRIYVEENKLKDLSDGERLKGRQKLVKPEVDAFFGYMHSLDSEDPAFSEHLSSAIRYALNHEEGLREFLDDPQVPLDNGFSERSVRSICQLRMNSLFSYSITGAEDNAIIESLAETAKANHANPRIYFQYLIDRMMDRNRSARITESFLKELMPWSDSYHEYEAGKKREIVDYMGTGPDKPPKVRVVDGKKKLIQPSA